MPVFELYCDRCEQSEDRYLRRWDDPTPVCPQCGGYRKRMAGRFAAPFSGSLRKYTDPKRENAHMEGFWAYRKRSSVSGKPEPVWLDSMEAVRAFNKAEGLSAPGDVPTYSTISADGKHIESRGMPGQWVTGMPEMPTRLREMVETPAEQCSAPAATAAPTMPIDHGLRVEPVEVTAEMNLDG